MGLPSFLKNKLIGDVVKKVADSEPRTTVAGAALGGLIAANIDYNKLAAGDNQEIGKGIAAVIVGLLGWWTNHKKLAQP